MLQGGSRGRISLSDKNTSMVIGDYVKVFGNERQWGELNIAADRKTFINQLEDIRNLRNNVMHFRPTGLEEGDMDHLRKFVEYLRILIHYKNS